MNMKNPHPGQIVKVRKYRLSLLSEGIDMAEIWVRATVIGYDEVCECLSVEYVDGTREVLEHGAWEE
jgi:hypothetical protein